MKKTKLLPLAAYTTHEDALIREFARKLEKKNPQNWTIKTIRIANEMYYYIVLENENYRAKVNLNQFNDELRVGALKIVRRRKVLKTMDDVLNVLST